MTTKLHNISTKMDGYPGYMLFQMFPDKPANVMGHNYPTYAAAEKAKNRRKSASKKK